MSRVNAAHCIKGVTLDVRHVPDGQFTQALLGLKQGELPFGNVALATDDTGPLAFVAGARGSLPLNSIPELSSSF